MKRINVCLALFAGRIHIAGVARFFFKIGEEAYEMYQYPDSSHRRKLKRFFWDKH